MASIFDVPLRDRPLPLITLAGIALAFSFNMGFFFSAGIAFLSLFTVQEHVIFSLSGVAVVASFGFLIWSLDALVDDMRVHTPGSVAFYATGVVFVITFGFIVATIVMDAYEEHGPPVAFPLFTLISGLSIYFGFLQTAATYEKKRAVTVGACVIFTFITGVVYANQQIHGEHKRTAIFERQSYGLVRAGSEYSLLVSDDRVVHAFRTEDLAGLSFSGNVPRN